MESITFGIFDLFTCSSDRKGRPTLLGPLETAGSSDCVSSLRDTTEYMSCTPHRKTQTDQVSETLFSSIQNFVLCAKFRNPVILSMNWFFTALNTCPVWENLKTPWPAIRANNTYLIQIKLIWVCEKCSQIKLPGLLSDERLLRTSGSYRTNLMPTCHIPKNVNVQMNDILLFTKWQQNQLPNMTNVRSDILWTSGSVVGWGTMLHLWRSRIRFLMRSLALLNLPNHSSNILVLTSTQPITGLSIRNLSLSKRRAALTADSLAPSLSRLSTERGSLQVL
jgi:hypothetical protein